MVSSSAATVGKYLAKVPGGIARSVASATTEPGNAREYARSFQATFNQHADAVVCYANDRLGADLRLTTVAFRFTDRRGDEAVRYLAADADATADDGTDVRVVGPDRFAELDWSVDERVDADWYLSRNAAAELRTFVREYAKPNRDPPKSYVATTAAKYGDSLDDELVDRGVAAATRS